MVGGNGRNIAWVVGGSWRQTHISGPTVVLDHDPWKLLAAQLTHVDPWAQSGSEES